MVLQQDSRINKNFFMRPEQALVY